MTSEPSLKVMQVSANVVDEVKVDDWMLKSVVVVRTWLPLSCTRDEDISSDVMRRQEAGS